ncbi:hypothetical protein NE237_006753 [Protea cynaroides]|uniref:Uncharacterized protein n=1 Tax=Protea cynaroides TaxID=273540 RepID=A0A9Q0KN73_9MAGN|nr:hypothetical protein NE237_006753 [Protea cynaroides]
MRLPFPQQLQKTPNASMVQRTRSDSMEGICYRLVSFFCRHHHRYRHCTINSNTSTVRSEFDFKFLEWSCEQGLRYQMLCKLCLQPQELGGRSFLISINEGHYQIQRNQDATAMETDDETYKRKKRRDAEMGKKERDAKDTVEIFYFRSNGQ